MDRRPKAPSPASCRIVELPVDILLDIVGRLSTRDAAVFLALSSSFQSVKVLLPRRDSITLSPTSSSFPKSDTSYFLRRLTIVDGDIIMLPRYSSLLEEAASHGVEELSLSHRIRGIPYPLPAPVLRIHSLSLLVLSSCSIAGPLQVDLPLLRRLRLHDVHLPEPKKFSYFLRSVPSLEFLDMVHCSGSTKCIIDADDVPRLKGFEINPSLTLTEIKLRMPNLEKLALYTRPKVRFIRVDAPKARKVYLRLSQPRGELNAQFLPFLQSIAGELQTLNLRGLAIKYISKELENVSEKTTTYKALKNLSICLDPSDEMHVEFLLKLLNECPSLKNLNISVGDLRKNMELPNFRMLAERLGKLRCLRALDHIELRDLKNAPYDKVLARVFMTKAKKMKTMLFEFPKDEKQLDAVNKVVSCRKPPTQEIFEKENSYRIKIYFRR